MNIKTKMTIGTGLLMFIPSLIVCVSLGMIAIQNGEVALHNQAQKQLFTVRDTTKQSIENTFSTIRAQVLTFSNDRMVIDAMKLFPSAFNIYTGQVGLSGNAGKEKLDTMRKSLKTYYTGDYSTEFANRNSNSSIDIDPWVQKLDAESIALQHEFISNNPNPLGEKDTLITLKNSTLYKTLHERFHPHFRDYQQQFKYYDIFLVDAKSGDIVYSVFKELDFTTSLKDGVFADSGIGEVFKKAAASEDPNFVAISDFSPYAPSYQDQAAFIASPIFEKKVMKGVLILQMPIDAISSVMTHKAKWEDVGLGKTGETYLVGTDSLMRSDSRFIIENADQYIQSLSNVGLDDTIIQALTAKKSSVGIQPVKTESVTAALNGETGFKTVKNLEGNNVLSAYAPLAIKGLNWGIIAEISQEESLISVEALKKSIVTYGGIITLIVLVVGAFLGLLIAKTMIRPLEDTVAAIRDIAEGEGDLTQRINIKNNDELGELGIWFNRFIEKLQILITNLHDVSSNLNSASTQLTEVSQAAKTGVINQQNQTEEAASATHEMSASVHEVAKNAETAANASLEARNKSNDSKQKVEDNISTMNALSTTVENANQVISKLEEDSNNIGGVLDVIRNIADQTNLLALNAAIEAARAGEQGRGFAVVADEVRTLASRTQESTEVIQKMIENLQVASKQAVAAMNETNSQAVKSTQLAHDTGESLLAVTEAINEVNEMNAQISHAAAEQSTASEKINQNILGISHIGERTAEAAQQTAQSGEELETISAKLMQLVGQYKI